MSRTSRARESIRRHLMAGVGAAVLLVGGVGGLAATTELAGAVVAPGTLVVESNSKKVQHPTGGVVGEIRVRDGDQVRTGDVLVRLDPTMTQANLAIVEKTLTEHRAREARLAAERDDTETVVFPDDLVARSDDPEVRRVLTGETNLFELRRRARAGQKAQLRERIAQLSEEIEGRSGQAAAKKREIDLIQTELEGVRELFRKNLIPIQRVTLLERDAARLEGERGQLISSIAQARGKISETELQIIQVDQELRSEVAKELREVQAKIAEYVERKVAAEDQLRRIDIRAPQDGFVHQLAVHTVGGVISPGDTLMLIVPASDALTVEAKIPPQHIDQVRPGQAAVLRFSAFNQRTTPEVKGEVLRVSADLTTDQRTGQSYYTVRIALPPAEIARLGNVRLMPGMPAEAFIKTDERTLLSYFVKPATDYLKRGFRER